MTGERTSDGAKIDTPSVLAVAPRRTLSMTTKDGLRLDADVYRPATGGPYPVLLQRQAYGREIACAICYAHPAWYAAQGYIVVTQDVRGRGTSEGRFHVGENEMSDGAEAVEWAARLDGSTGDVGMYGFSYQGYNQLLAAVGDSPSLKALAPAMFPWHARETWAWENGAFRLGGALGWAIQIAAETARHSGDTKAFAELQAASKGLPVNDEVACRPALMEKHAALSHYHRWLDTPAEDPYWSKISPASHIEAIIARRLPMLMVGGWYDSQLRGTLEAFRALEGSSHAPLHLAIGPWLHFPWDRKAGALDFGPDAASQIDHLTVRWFDHWLKGSDGGFAAAAPIRLFDMGDRTWRDFAGWPRKSISFVLEGDGRASIDPLAGRLRIGQNAQETGIEYLVQDPWRPAPAIGGVFGSPPGPVNRSMLDARGDVLTFTTPPLTEPMTLAGNVTANLCVESEAPSFDLSCVLSRVTAQGQSYPLTEGYRTVGPSDDRHDIAVPMRATCATLRSGEALRLSIAGAAFPAFPVNPGTGESATTTPTGRARITTIGVRHGGTSASRLTVSVPD